MNGLNAPIIVMVGTKAQFIKTAPVLVAMDRIGLSYRLVYTGQHSETFDVLEQVFGISGASDNLVPGTEADTARGLLGWSFRFIRAAHARIRAGAWRGARWGVVHGDTASALLGALALRWAGVPVAHVEAGLRSPRLWSPFPEEIIRRLVSRIATLHFAPDDRSVSNLAGARGVVVDTGGNTLADALRLALEAPAAGGACEAEPAYAVVSLHRSENLGSPARLSLLMQEIARASRILPIRFVLHPVTRKTLARTGWWDTLAAEPGVTMMERTDYVNFIRLLRGARFLMTDGGSNQEEAAMLGMPTLLLRAETERHDGLDTGVVEVSGLEPLRIRAFVEAHAHGAWQPVLRLPEGSPSAVIARCLVGARTPGDPR